MDLVTTLAGQLGIDPTQAQAVAGAVLGQVQDQVRGEDPSSAAAIADAVPELGTWKQAATAQLPGDTGLDDLLGALQGGDAQGMLGGLAGALGGGLGNDLLGRVAGAEAAEQAQVVALLGQLGVSAEQALVVVPTVLDFLRDRLPEGALQQVLQYAPMLMSVAKGGGKGGAGGLLGGLLG